MRRSVPASVTLPRGQSVASPVEEVASFPEPADVRLFTVGPVAMAADLRSLASQPLPYNRTSTFSALTHELLAGLRTLFDTTGEIVLLTCSGTGAMEATLQNVLEPRDRVLVINGGVFGQRWIELCQLLGIPFEAWHLECGEPLDPDALDERLASQSYTALLLTVHETSTGVLHDMQRVGAVAARHGVFVVADAISTIGADDFHMDAWQVDVAILSSQKALALPPGLAFVALSARARGRVSRIRPRSLYFRFEDYLRNQERGQSPFTPAVGLYVLLHERLRQITEHGTDRLVAVHAQRAGYFRELIRSLPFRQLTVRPSNALTALQVPPSLDARHIVDRLAADYRMFVTPNGGDFSARVFRVGHLGEQSLSDLDRLRDALGALVMSSPPANLQGGSA